MAEADRSQDVADRWWSRQTGQVAYLYALAVAGILGHLSLQSTQIYAKVDVEALRRAALDPEVLHE